MDECMSEMPGPMMEGRDKPVPFERRKALLRAAEGIVERIMVDAPQVRERRLLMRMIDSLMDRG